MRDGVFVASVRSPTLPNMVWISWRHVPHFVRATGHRTFAEIPPDPKNYPGALPHMLYAGSLVFTPLSHPIDLKNLDEWWTYAKGADWRHPYGPKSNINTRDNHPVVARF